MTRRESKQWRLHRTHRLIVGRRAIFVAPLCVLMLGASQCAVKSKPTICNDTACSATVNANIGGASLASFQQAAAITAALLAVKPDPDKPSKLPCAALVEEDPLTVTTNSSKYVTVTWTLVQISSSLGTLKFAADGIVFKNNNGAFSSPVVASDRMSITSTTTRTPTPQGGLSYDVQFEFAFKDGASVPFSCSTDPIIVNVVQN